MSFTSRGSRGEWWRGHDLRALTALNDSALRPFLAATDEAARVAALERIVEEVACPAIERVLRQCRRGLDAAGGPSAAEEIEAAVLLRVVQKLESARFSEDDAVARLEEYVARLTFNAVADLRRQSAPEWARLKRRLRYIAGTDDRLAVWDLPSMTVCGLAAWRDRVDVLAELPIDADSAPQSLRDRRRPGDSLFELLTLAGAPLPLDAVTELFDTLWAVDVAAVDPGGDGTDPVSAYETREQLQIVWEEICALPAKQRAALLLNLRDEQGRNAVVLFPLTGVASFDEIAAAIEMSADELIALWSRLPLADLDIAETLGLGRQQVINLRKSARARLQRRIAARQKRSGR